MSTKLTKKQALILKSFKDGGKENSSELISRKLSIKRDVVEDECVKLYDKGLIKYPVYGDNLVYYIQDEHLTDKGSSILSRIK